MPLGVKPSVATCSEDGSLVFWHTATGKERGRVSIAALGPAGYVSSMLSAIAFAPDGKWLHPRHGFVLARSVRQVIIQKRL